MIKIHYITLRFLIIVPMALAAAFACSNYDSPDDVHITAYGTYFEYGRGVEAKFYLLQDDGTTLFVKDQFWNDDTNKYNDGDRVKFNYEIVNNTGGARTMASGKTHDIALYYIVPVPEHDPVALSFIMEDEEHRRDSIGNDPLGGISNILFSGSYVNVEYTYWQKGRESHIVRLVVDDLSVKDDKVTMYIYHSANGNAPKGSESGLTQKESLVSFDIGQFLHKGKDKITVEFVWTEYVTGKNKTWNDVRNPTAKVLVKSGSGN